VGKFDVKVVVALDEKGGVRVRIGDGSVYTVQ
jgi:hypothetical protein